MTKLKLGPLVEDKPVRKMVEFPAEVWASLTVYADLLGRTAAGQTAPDPAKLIVPMVERFMATDRGFAKARRSADHAGGGSAERSG